MDKIINFVKAVFYFLKGKKTYIVGGLMIILGYLQNDNQMIMDGLGFMTIRAGIKTALQAMLTAR